MLGYKINLNFATCFDKDGFYLTECQSIINRIV